MKNISIKTKLSLLILTYLCSIHFAHTQNESDTLFIFQVEELEEFVFKSQAQTIKLETNKISYQVENDASSRTESVLEMLRKIPMVTVDGRNNIFVNGSSQFKVYVDGELNTSITRNPSKMLRNMPANNVKKIEVITNPGVQYDAEGAGGILYIITKNNISMNSSLLEKNIESATYGSLHTTLGLKTWGLDANISSQKKRWSWDLNLNGEYMYSPDAVISSEVISNTSSQYMKQSSISKMPFAIGSLDISYKIDSNQSIHTNLSINGFGMKDQGHPFYNYFGSLWGDSITFGGWNMMNERELSIDGSISYQKQLNNSGSLNISYQVNHNPNINTTENTYSNFSNTPSESILSAIKNNQLEVSNCNNSHNLITDISIPLSKYHILNTGVKMTADLGESNASKIILDGSDYIESADESFHYKENQYIAALYGEWDAMWNSFNLKGGLRYEYTWQKSIHIKGNGSDFTIKYGDLVPALSLTKRINNKHILGLNYNMRIRRPQIRELNPYINTSDPTCIFYGNPNLKAQHINNLSLVYIPSFDEISIRLGFSHKWSNDGITQYSKLIEDKINTTFGNISINHTTAMNLYVLWSIGNNSQFMISGECGYSEINTKDASMHNYGFYGNTNIGFQQNLPWNIKWSTNIEWLSKTYTLQGYESGMTMLSSTITRSFYKDRWNVAISIETGIGNGGKIVWESVSKTEDFTNISRYIDPMQNITLGISYSFGGTKEDKENTMQNFIEKNDFTGGKHQIRRR